MIALTRHIKQKDFAKYRKTGSFALLTAKPSTACFYFCTLSRLTAGNEVFETAAIA